MITSESITRNGQEYRRTASDTYKIRKIGTNEIYVEAVDLPEAAWEYEETDIPLPDEISDSEALAILLGGRNDKT